MTLLSLKLVNSQRPVAISRRQNVKCLAADGKGDFQQRFKEFVERRKEMDKKRVEKIKDIGNKIDNIAKDEAKYSTDMVNEWLPFLKDIDMKGVKEMLENVKPKHDCKCGKEQVADDEESSDEE